MNTESQQSSWWSQVIDELGERAMDGLLWLDEKWHDLMAYFDTRDRLTQLYDEARRIPVTDSSRFVLFSDCHRGDGSWADDFAHNADLFFHALRYYNGESVKIDDRDTPGAHTPYTYIELGDGDELWEQENFRDLVEAHSHVYWKLAEFYRDQRLYLIWGNHNRAWKHEPNRREFLEEYYDERDRQYHPLFPGIKVHESLVLEYGEGHHTIFLLHGHQVDVLNDRFWFLGRFVAGMWKFLQLAGTKDPTSPAKNFTRRNRIEAKLIEYTQVHHQVMIAGHTHRSVLLPPSSLFYVNAGSCVHPRCILALEIADGSIVLVKWHRESDEAGRLCVRRCKLAGPYDLADYWEKMR